MSALQWWQLAGVDEVIVEEPAEWLAKSAEKVNWVEATIEQRGSVVSAAKTIEPLPTSLLEFRRWLASTEELPESIPHSSRISLSGPEQSEWAVMVDMAELEDRQSGRLMSGPAGMLLDAMLRAIGRTREDVALLPLIPGRTPTGRPAEQTLQRWGEIGRHHLHLIGAKRVLLMGESVNRAILGAGLTELRGELRGINQDQSRIAAVATFDLRFLLRQTSRKSDAWQDLLLFAKDI